MLSMDDKYSLYNMENIKRCKVDPEYLGEVMLANENLIWYAIHKYVGKPEALIENNGLDKDDILQQGRLGFLKAIYAFDTERGIKFSSFAVTAIVREVRTYLRDYTNVIRLTRNAHALIREIKRIENDFGYLPTVEELALLLDEKEEKIKKALQVGKPVKYLEEQISDSITCMDALEDDYTENFEEKLIDKIHVDNIINAIRANLTPTEVDILLSQMKGLSQTQTAKEHKMSQMRVSRILKKVAHLINKANIKL